MDILAWQSDLEGALAASLARSLEQLRGHAVERLDLGVFPWQGLIQTSFLLRDDLDDEVCDPRDVAAWPHFDHSDVSGGHWPEASALCDEMRQGWTADKGNAAGYFKAAAAALQSSRVAAILREFDRAAGFAVTLHDPDRPHLDYCAA
jgi:hypothetical protein